MIFEVEGFRKLGFRGYAGKFFPIYEFKNGIGGGRHRDVRRPRRAACSSSSSPSRCRCDSSATSTAARSPSASSPALTVVIIPVGLLGLDFMLNAIQALIFSILTLMYIILAIESHGHEEGQSPRRRSTPSTARRIDCSPPTDDASRRQPTRSQ